MGAIIAQLLIALGPSAIGLVQHLVQIWNTPSLNPEQVVTTCSVLGKTYDDYMKDAGVHTPPNTSPSPPTA